MTLSKTCTMNDFDEYIKQGDPDQREKAIIWRTAIGLQQVDGLKPSAYLIEIARQNIEGHITIAEVKNRIAAYYKISEKKKAGADNRTKEADTVSARIAEILSENTFSFSPAEYLNIHKRLFAGIYKFAGKMRECNITKAEWALDGDTVLYAGADNLRATLEYDFDRERKFSYRGLTRQQMIEHIAHFISNLWQIHIFGEGNTRTTAVFLIKYLRKLGFRNVNNDLFDRHSWYFRNALVRANYKNLDDGVYSTNMYLERFLGNLLLGEKNTLKNRELHIHYAPTDNTTPQGGRKKVVRQGGQTRRQGGQTRWSENLIKVFDLIRKNPQVTRKELSETLKINPSAVQKHLEKLKGERIIIRVGSDNAGSWKILKIKRR